MRRQAGQIGGPPCSHLDAADSGRGSRERQRVSGDLGIRICACRRLVSSWTGRYYPKLCINKSSMCFRWRLAFAMHWSVIGAVTTFGLFPAFTLISPC